eukprot:gene713-2509_t
MLKEAVKLPTANRRWLIQERSQVQSAYSRAFGTVAPSHQQPNPLRLRSRVCRDFHKFKNLTDPEKIEECLIVARFHAETIEIVDRDDGKPIPFEDPNKKQAPELKPEDPRPEWGEGTEFQHDADAPDAPSRSDLDAAERMGISWDGVMAQKTIPIQNRQMLLSQIQPTNHTRIEADGTLNRGGQSDQATTSSQGIPDDSQEDTS